MSIKKTNEIKKNNRKIQYNTEREDGQKEVYIPAEIEYDIEDQNSTTLCAFSPSLAFGN